MPAGCVWARAPLAAVTVMSGQTQLIDLDPVRSFDAVVHVRQFTPARGAVDPPASITEP